MPTPAESVQSTREYSPENFSNFNEISKIIWRNSNTFIQELPEEERDVAKSLLLIPKTGNPKTDTRTVRERYQTLQTYRKQWKSIPEIEQLIREWTEYIDNNISSLNIQDQQKQYVWNGLKKLWVRNANTIIDFMKNENDRNYGFILLDVLTFIKEDTWDIFKWNIRLSDDWIDAIKAIYPDIDTNHITLSRLDENLLKDNEEIDNITRQAIESTLNERFLSTLDEEIRYNTDIETSNNTVDKIIENPNSLRFFIDYYNYKNPQKALWIDPNKPIQPEDRKKLEKAIKEELYENWFIVDLTDSEKEQLDIEINNKIITAKENMRWFRRWRWGNLWRFLGKFKDNPESSNYDEKSWKQIAYELGIWEELTKTFTNTNKIDTNDSQKFERIFNHARRKFCRNNRGLWLWRFTPEFIKELYQETNNFTNFEGNWKNLKDFELSFWNNKSKFNVARSSLRLFNNYLNNAQDKATEFQSEINKSINTRTNNSAIGTVIDWIRYIFADLWEENNIDNKIQNLELDKQKPVELENNNEWLVINWFFKGNPVRIKYDLMTWEVYMNACINRKFPWNDIIFWRDEPDYYIWKIPNFTAILKGYTATPVETQNEWTPSIEEMKNRRKYRREKIQESFERGIDEIKDIIWDQIETNQIKNEVSTNFLKALRIIEDKPNSTRTNWEVNFEEWSDAYNVMQIINNSKKEDIIMLEKTMNALSIYSWIIWGKNEMNKNYTEYKTINNNNEILNEEGNEQLIDLKNFWWNIQKFTYYEWSPWSRQENPITERWSIQPDSEQNAWFIPKNYKNWLATVIYENFTNGESSPDWKLDKRKMTIYVENIAEQYDKLHAESLLKP